jgi:PAS domain-containing protein
MTHDPAPDPAHDRAHPRGSADELGALLAAMGVMRGNIKMMMDREVEQRRSAQARLADALEYSQEGVVVVDANDVIVLANAQAADFLGISGGLLKPGTPLMQLTPALWGRRRRLAHAHAARQEFARHQRDADGGRSLAAVEPQPDERRRFHRAVRRRQSAQATGMVASSIQSVARCPR